MAWTEQQIQTLKKMWGNGYSASDIARALGGGLTRNAVIGKAHRLKLSVGRVSNGGQVSESTCRQRGNSLSGMVKISKKRSMLRPLPKIQTTEVYPRINTQEMIARLENIKRTEGIAVIKAGERHCRWPIGDPRSPDFRFCGSPCHEGLPYCVDHARVAYQTVSRRSRISSNERLFGDIKIPGTMFIDRRKS